MWIILGVLFSFGAWALDPSETIANVKILKVLPNNVISLNRGLEDGIMRNDHIKLSNETVGFSSRAICLRALNDVSYWRLYRIPSSEAFSMDYLYTITGLGDKEIPNPELKLRDSEVEIKGLDEKKEEGNALLEFFGIKRDLPEKLSEKDFPKPKKH